MKGLKINIKFKPVTVDNIQLYKLVYFKIDFDKFLEQDFINSKVYIHQYYHLAKNEFSVCIDKLHDTRAYNFNIGHIYSKETIEILENDIRLIHKSYKDVMYAYKASQVTLDLGIPDKLNTYIDKDLYIYTNL